MRKWLAAALTAALVTACGNGPDAPQCGAPGPGWVAFIDRTSGPFTIAVAQDDGRCQRTVASDAGGALSPSWSTTTHQLAYSGADAGEAAIRVHDFVTGLTTTIAVAPLVPGTVALSPDGTKIAFEGRLGTASPDLYTVPVAGGDPTAVTSTTGSDAGPAWSPDGHSIYFVSDRAGGVSEIWSVGVDGNDPIQITTGSKVLGHPTVSPDGTKIAYSRRKPDSTSQIVEHVVGTGAERILSDDRDGEPAYDATGSRIAVSTYRFGGGADVAILDATTGAVLFRVTDGTGTSGSPAFPR